VAKSFNVSENIGFDGYSYYCRRCGKAGYDKPSRVRGHLAMCPGTLIRKGASPTTSCNQLPTGNHAGLRDRGANQLQVVRGASFGDLPEGQLQPVEVVAGRGSYQLDDHYQQLDGRIAALENEYNHFLMERNRPSSESWVSRNMAWIVLGGILLVALLTSFNQQCPVSVGAAGSSPKRSGPDMSKLTERLVNKAADTAITKGFGRLFS
jgi:hypothetical protein